MSYPVLPQMLRMCSKSVGNKVEGWYQKRAVHHFLDHFQGDFKDRHRYFAGVWLLYRLILHANDAFAPNCTVGFAIQISFGIIFLLLHSIFRPNKKTKYDILDSLLLANIALLSTLGLMSWAIAGQDADTTALTVLITMLLILPYLYFFCIVVYRIANCIYIHRLRCCNGEDVGEQEPLFDVATAALKNRFRSWQSRMNASNGHTDIIHDDDGSAEEDEELRGSASYCSNNYGSVNVRGLRPTMSEVEVSVDLTNATDEAQDN